MSKAFGIITCASKKTTVEKMEDYRSIGAFSFLGRYRIIDFSISNMSNSDISRIQIFVSGTKPRSLIEHVGSGRHYNVNSKRGKVQLLFSEAGTIKNIYSTDVNAYLENIDFIRRVHEEYVIIAPSYVICKVDYQDLLQKHIDSGADITLLYHRVHDAQEAFLNSYTVTLNRQKGVLCIEKNRGSAKDRNIFMDSYIMKKDLFIDLLYMAKKLSSVCTLQQIVDEQCRNGSMDVRGVPHRGYFEAIVDFESYYRAQMESLNIDSLETLFEDQWPIYTRTSDTSPTQYFNGSEVRNSFIANGCVIEGTVENSVIGRGCKIEKGAVVRNSVILAYSTIGEGVHVENQVVDKWAQIIQTKEIVSPPDNPGYIKRDDKL